MNYDLKIQGHSFLPSTGQDTVMTVNAGGEEKQFSITNIKSFDGSMVGGEDFTVYAVARKQ